MEEIGATGELDVSHGQIMVAHGICIFGREQSPRDHKLEKHPEYGV